MGKLLLNIGVAAAFFTAISLASYRKERNVSPEDYLEWPRIDYDQDKPHAQIRDAIKILLELAWIEGDWDEESNIEQLEKASRSDRFSHDEQEIYRKILIVAYGARCDKEQVNLLQSIWAQVQLGGIPKELEPFVKRIGLIFSMSCSSIYSSRKKRWVISPDLIKQLDRVFAAAFSEKHDHRPNSVDRVRLTGSLQEFDLATDTFNAQKMVAVMRELSDDENAYQEEPFVLLKDFLLDRCDLFDDSLKEVLTIIDLGRKFQISHNWANDYLKRADEYNRLCLTLSSPEKQILIRKNLENQLTMPPKRRK